MLIFFAAYLAPNNAGQDERNIRSPSLFAASERWVLCFSKPAPVVRVEGLT
jgi:hypothetical protein